MIMKIALTQGRQAEVDASDFGHLSQFKWQYLPEAAHVYNQVAEQLFGEHAYLNEIN